MSKTAYIGITGVMSRSESKSLISSARINGFFGSYKGLVWGQVSDPSQYIPQDELSNVFVDDPRVFNVLHYNSRAHGLLGQIERLLSNVEIADGIQLNIPWPDPAILRRLRERYYVEVILQVSAEAMNMLDNNPNTIAAKIRQYDGLIDYVLIDPSGGVGTEFELSRIVPILEDCIALGLDIGLGVAGGLRAGRLDVLKPLLKICPDLSWDAQAGLRTVDRQALDLAACERYMLEGIALLHKQPGRDSTTEPI
jgi:hypothetical protein